MCVLFPAKSFADDSADLSLSGVNLQVYPEDDTCVIRVTGELDLATYDEMFTASTHGTHPAMVIDLAGVTFLDCAGYSSIVASRLAVERAGGTLTLRGQTGQPARLLDLIAAFET